MRKYSLGNRAAIALAIAALSGASFASLASGCSSDTSGAVFATDGSTSGNDTGSTTLPDGGSVFVGDSGVLADGRSCTNLECYQVTCDGNAQTGITGKVYDPAGKVALYNAIVYVPNQLPLKDITSGASCDTCDGTAFNPLVSALTDATGTFTLKNVPVMDDMPLVVQIGKWRRLIKLPKPTACQTTTIADNSIRLPRNKSEGSLPRIALSTGGADPLECLLRKIGIDDSEFDVLPASGTPTATTGSVNLFAGYGYSDGTTSRTGASKFDGSLHGGAAFPASQSLWTSPTSLANYDLVLLACEGASNPNTKPQQALDAMQGYENAGGRVFASHWHDYWFEKQPATSSIASWTDLTPPPPDPSDGVIDDTFPKGAAFKQWLAANSSLTPQGGITIYQPKDNVTAVTPDGGAQQWITMPNPNASGGGAQALEYLTFNTPVGAAKQCGRVVYTDLHVSASPNVSGGDQTGAPFPTGCVTTELTAQQKALEFMLFDLSSCVQSDSVQPTPPK